MDAKYLSSARIRFEQKIERVTESGCWVWMAAGHPTGYGRFGLKNAVDFAHRASWKLFIGAVPKGMYVCHRCDVRLCVNPAHLFIGSAKDNMQDAAQKGRTRIPPASYASDDTHQMAKLTNTQVRCIRSSQLSNIQLAQQFNVVKETIWKAKTKRTFKGVL